MRRHLLKLAAALSLIVCLASGGLWVRSRFASDLIEWTVVRQHGPDVVTRKISLLVADTGERSSVRLTWKGVVAGGVDPLSIGTVWQDARREAGFRYGRPSWTDVDVYDRITLWNRLGFYTTHTSVTRPVSGRMSRMQLVTDQVGLPLWALPAATAVIPIAWATSERLRRQSRRKRGLCVRCGYDLRASFGRCPECGIRSDRPPTVASLADGSRSSTSIS